MSVAALRIDRVAIDLFGVSQEIAEAALSGLEGELARRIDAVGLRAAQLPRVDLAEVVLGPLTAPANIDPAALRALIADALAGHMFDGDAGTAPRDDVPPEDG